MDRDVLNSAIGTIAAVPILLVTLGWLSSMLDRIVGYVGKRWCVSQPSTCNAPDLSELKSSLRQALELEVHPFDTNLYERSGVPKCWYDEYMRSCRLTAKLRLRLDGIQKSHDIRDALVRAELDRFIKERRPSATLFEQHVLYDQLHRELTRDTGLSDIVFSSQYLFADNHLLMRFRVLKAAAWRLARVAMRGIWWFSKPVFAWFLFSFTSSPFEQSVLSLLLLMWAQLNLFKSRMFVQAAFERRQFAMAMNSIRATWGRPLDALEWLDWAQSERDSQHDPIKNWLHWASWGLVIAVALVKLAVLVMG